MVSYGMVVLILFMGSVCGAWQSMIYIASKLNYKNLNEEVLKHFARLQSRDDQVCAVLITFTFSLVASIYPPLGLILDMMLVWRKENINWAIAECKREDDFTVWLIFGLSSMSTLKRSSFLACNSDCVAPYVDNSLHIGWLWAISTPSGSLRWWCLRSCWMVLSNVMQALPGCLLQGVYNSWKSWKSPGIWKPSWKSWKSPGI